MSDPMTSDAGTQTKRGFCGKCGCTNTASVELHPCPYLSDVEDDETTFCKCCDECQDECARDI